jgi:hypothetical protein
MQDLSLDQAMDNVYAALHDDNREIDTHIAGLKAALEREGKTEAVFDPKKLAQSNRQGRKTMQAYFKKKGVTVSFAE